ncbi:unnamed protein product [Lepeophtheirus salmonis]|uniref:(salmon louse) hypothetical protein n=1 Tax=Lepeophtheirus salmonis TaxID=72036 RepID=A0A7R8CGW5_LEPSM|nr:unnamed protein product [Lepeophtheirus salmonis]CAF2819102.1 unnamed protein product [Lepeophtheirus salmonis]
MPITENQERLQVGKNKRRPYGLQPNTSRDLGDIQDTKGDLQASRGYHSFIKVQCFFCNTCGQNLCRTCRYDTHRAKMFSQHEIVHISNKLMNSGKKCIQHREPISMFCMKQNSLLCGKCYDEADMEIKIQCVDVDSAYKEGIHEIEKSLITIWNFNSSLQNVINKFQNFESDLHHNLEIQKTELKKKYLKITENIRSIYDDLIKELDNQYEIKNKEFQDEIAKIKNIIPTIQMHLLLMTSFTFTTNKLDFLSIVYEAIDRLNLLVHVKLPERKNLCSIVSVDNVSQFLNSIKAMQLLNSDDGTHIINGTNKENKSSTSIISSSSNTNIEENSFSETFYRSQIIERDLYHHCQIFEAQLKEQKKWNQQEEKHLNEQSVFKEQMNDLNHIRHNLHYIINITSQIEPYLKSLKNINFVSDSEPVFSQVKFSEMADICRLILEQRHIEEHEKLFIQPDEEFIELHSIPCANCEIGIDSKKGIISSFLQKVRQRNDNSDNIKDIYKPNESKKYEKEECTNGTTFKRLSSKLSDMTNEQQNIHKPYEPPVLGKPSRVTPVGLDEGDTCSNQNADKISTDSCLESDSVEVLSEVVALSNSEKQSSSSVETNSLFNPSSSCFSCDKHKTNNKKYYRPLNEILIGGSDEIYSQIDGLGSSISAFQQSFMNDNPKKYVQDLDPQCQFDIDNYSSDETEAIPPPGIYSGSSGCSIGQIKAIIHRDAVCSKRSSFDTFFPSYVKQAAKISNTAKQCESNEIFKENNSMVEGNMKRSDSFEGHEETVRTLVEAVQESRKIESYKKSESPLLVE